MLYTIPYVLAGSSLRVIEDAELLSPPWKYLLITPLIYFLVFAVTIAALLLTRKILGRDFYRGYAAIGLLWTLLNLAALATVGLQEHLGHSRGLLSRLGPDRGILSPEADSALAELSG